MLSDIRPILLGSSQRFLCVKPKRRSVAQIVVSEPGSIPRSISASLISAKVTPLRFVVSSRSRSSCPASNGLR
jgi:hypothetical protein